MAFRSPNFGRDSALPFDVALASIAALPRPLLARLVDCAIDRLDTLDPDPDLEMDDEPEDEGHAEYEIGRPLPQLGIDQSESWWVRRVKVTDL